MVYSTPWRQMVASLAVLWCVAGAGVGMPLARSAESAAAPDKAKQPIPSSGEQQQAEKLVRDVYHKELTKAVKPAEKAAVAKVLLEQAGQPGNDAITQYALLTMARDLSVSANDTTTVLAAIDQLTVKFVVDDLAMRTDALKEVGGKAPITGQKLVLAAALDSVQQATAREQFDTALRLVGIAIESARKVSDPKTLKQAADLKQELTRLEQEFDAVKRARAKLGANPDDAEANLTVGRWEWFVKADIDGAMAKLAKGSDPLLKVAAEKDRAKPNDPQAQMEVADLWWKLGQSKPEGREKDRLLNRAHQQYTYCRPQLTGLVKVRVMQRIAELEERIKKLEAQLAQSEPPKPGTPTPPKPGHPGPPPQIPKEWKDIVSHSAKVRVEGCGPMSLQESDDKKGWKLVPLLLKGLHGTIHSNQADQYNGMAHIEVLKGGYLLLACNYSYQGNDSGDWTESRWTREQFLAHGWQHIPDEVLGGTLTKNYNDRTQVIFVKQVKQGEKLNLRCNKYDQPFAIEF